MVLAQETIESPFVPLLQRGKVKEIEVQSRKLKSTIPSPL